MAKEEEDDILVLKPYKPEKKKEKLERVHYRKTDVLEITVQDEFRKVNGQIELLKHHGMSKPEKGKSIHVASGGNVDLICFVKWILLHWPHIRRMFISCWSIGSVDICLIKRWIEGGILDYADILVGDVFPSIHPKEWEKLTEMYNDRLIRNLYRDTIHSKLILLEISDDEHIVVESSANCNMNPRIEQSVVTVSSELYHFYDDYFREIFEQEKLGEAVRDLAKLELKTEIDDEESDILQGE